MTVWYLRNKNSTLKFIYFTMITDTIITEIRSEIIINEITGNFETSYHKEMMHVNCKQYTVHCINNYIDTRT